MMYLTNKINLKTDLVVHACKPNTKGDEVGGPQV